MRAFNGIMAAVGALIIVIFAAANISLNLILTPENGKPYRVEINRAALEIEENGSESIDLTKYVYINNIVKFSADGEQDFYNTNSEYAIREINGSLYRFDYSAKDDTHRRQIVITVNIILGALTAAVLGVLLYIKRTVLQPFRRLTNVPYELSKGNLTVPLKESKNRFFGKFMWGMDLLRENIEQRKQRELELQREKKTLLLSLSHDIKTPLSAIKLYSRALSKNLYPDAEKQREIAENINAKADEIERYVSQIIGASREDFLALEVKNGDFYLSDLLQAVASYYSEKTALAKTDFRIGQYGNCLLCGDLDRGIEVLQNVVENAMKYGDGKLIELNVADEDEGVLVSVKNSGCTLDKKELPHIFESFWRGANSVGVQGSGLGLYICRELMRKMNGEFFAEIEGEFMTVTAVFVKA